MATAVAKATLSLTSYNPGGEKGSMFQYQSSLPKLPVPGLQQSLEKYLRAIQPLVSEEQFRHTRSVVEQFSTGPGKELQRKLEERAASHDNWLYQWWLDRAYLGYRPSIVINSSAGSCYDGPFINEKNFLHYAARLIVIHVKFQLLSVREYFPPEVIRGIPLCMSQYREFLSCCRIPGEKVDHQRRTNIEQSRHVIVAHNGHFFSLEVLVWYEGSYHLVPWQHIEEQLHNIVNSSPAVTTHPVGLLTAEHRDQWYKARNTLLCDPVNAHNLEMIETAQFVLGLESIQSLTHPQTSSSDFYSILSGACLHGNGSTNSTANRWFDHSIQSFIFKEGFLGSNIEHSAADGTSAIQLTFSIQRNIQSEELLSYQCPVPKDRLSAAEHLKWNISPTTIADIQTAKDNIDRAIADCDHKVIVFDHYGKELIKSFKMSPDSFIQIALQLTYYKLYGQLCATYESAATRKFLYSRTDTIRASSIEALEFSKAMCDESVSNTEKFRKLVTAIKAHHEYAVEAVSGQVFDRHLFGLRILAAQSNDEMPSLFTDQSFAKIFHFNLSTSQMVSDCPVFCAFGAVVPDGYGICYNPLADKILFTISCYHQCLHTSTDKYLVALVNSLKEMRSVVESQITNKL